MFSQCYIWMDLRWQAFCAFLGGWPRVATWLFLVVGESVALWGALSNAVWSGPVAAGVLLVYALIVPFFGEVPLFGQSVRYKRRKEATRWLNPSMDIRKMTVDISDIRLAEDWVIYITGQKQAWETLLDPHSTFDEKMEANVLIDERPDHPGMIGELAKFIVIEMYSTRGENALRREGYGLNEAQTIYLATYLGAEIAKETHDAIVEAIGHYQETLIGLLPMSGSVHVFEKDNPLSKLKIVPPMPERNAFEKRQS